MDSTEARARDLSHKVGTAAYELTRRNKTERSVWADFVYIKEVHPIILAALKADDESLTVLKAGLDTAIKCGDTQREKIKDLEKYRTKLIRAIGSVMHECSKNKYKPELLIGAIKKIVMNVLAPDTCHKCYQRKVEFESPDFLCKECSLEARRQRDGI